MVTHRSLADLLAMVLDLDPGGPVYATPGFRGWLRSSDRALWPPRPDGGGLWLIDTRDAEGRRLLSAWASEPRAHDPDAALVLGRGAPQGSLVRRIVRRLRGTPRRIPVGRMEALVSQASPGLQFTRLGFEHDWDAPVDFQVANAAASAHGAMLLSRRAPFRGALHERIATLLGTRFDLLSFQLRLRGAVVLLLRTPDGGRVVRLVPAGPLQPVVERNHHMLLELRERLAGSASLLSRIPEPLFAQHDGQLLLLGETLLPGTLAWKLSGPERTLIIRRHALEFLALVRSHGGSRSAPGPEVVNAQCAADLAGVAAADFVTPKARHLLEGEIAGARNALAHVEIAPHVSHGDFGFGNILADESGAVTGVIDWDTARLDDLPGADRVNLEIQLERTAQRPAFDHAVRAVWEKGTAREALEGPGGAPRVRALFGIGVCRYITRALRYPDVYRQEAAGFERALEWLRRTPF